MNSQSYLISIKNIYICIYFKQKGLLKLVHLDLDKNIAVLILYNFIYLTMFDLIPLVNIYIVYFMFF